MVTLITMESSDNLMKGHFEIRAYGGDGGVRFRWELVAPMGQVMATADGFSTGEEAQTAIQWVKDSVAECPVQFRGTREMNP